MCVVGNKKMAIWDDLNMESPLVIYDKTITKEDNHNLVDNFIAYKTACVDGGISIPRVPKTPPLQIECQHFISCIEENKAPQTDGYSGYQVVKILEAATESLQKRVKT